MHNLSIQDMLQMQQALQEKNKDNWPPIEPTSARNFILWMMEELGEVIAIIKKRGETEITTDKDLRKEFVTELADVLMYFHNILMSYNITSKEISEAYTNKHAKNMARDFIAEHENYRKG